MTASLNNARELIQNFAHFEIQQLPWSANVQVDALANLVSATAKEWRRLIFMEFLVEPSVGGTTSVGTNVYEIRNKKENSWMDPILNYIYNKTLPMDKTETWKLSLISAW